MKTTRFRFNASLGIVALNMLAKIIKICSKKHGIIVSMRSKGDCCDNSVMERVWGSLKSERTDGVRYLTQRQAVNHVVDYFEMFYNTERLHSTISYLSPAEFEKRINISL